MDRFVYNMRREITIICDFGTIGFIMYATMLGLICLFNRVGQTYFN